MPAHLEELNLPTLNSKISLFYQNIFARVLTLKRPSHELKKLNQTLASSAVDLNPHQRDETLPTFKSILFGGLHNA
ncbi:MAG TPA: hypothetical protein ACFYD7_08775 [Candidatus Wujingus californicus]|uniref:hypothetical protein n=1 Tax=Candidatus Wujingus californicus TaxID=3367618 RepID=UPI001D895CB3|nr:hypothetical protein [Planctomycetota bacterium]MDO8130504.1 hypothetical protein [Candidatus Brocadiales bacterium]